MSEESGPDQDAVVEPEQHAETADTTPDTAVDEPSAGTVRPRRPRNDFSWVGMVLGIVAVALNVSADVGYGPGLAGVLFSGVGVWVATRHDLGMARSLSGLLLSFCALAVAVYTAGITSYQ